MSFPDSAVAGTAMGVRLGAAGPPPEARGLHRISANLRIMLRLSTVTRAK